MKQLHIVLFYYYYYIKKHIIMNFNITVYVVVSFIALFRSHHFLFHILSLYLFSQRAYGSSGMKPYMQIVQVGWVSSLKKYDESYFSFLFVSFKKGKKQKQRTFFFLKIFFPFNFLKIIQDCLTQHLLKKAPSSLRRNDLYASF